MASVYEALSEVASNPRARQHLKVLAETERRHERAWAELLASLTRKDSIQASQMVARLLAILARVVGIGPALALAGAAEGLVFLWYLSQLSPLSNAKAQGVLRRVL